MPSSAKSRRYPAWLVSLALVAAAAIPVGIVTAFASSESSGGGLTERGAAGKPLDIGFADVEFEKSNRKRWLRKAESINADDIRINMYWSLVAAIKPTDPRDPADPAYRWGLYDDAIRGAVDRGFEVNLTVLAAPKWAEGPNRPKSLEKAPPGSWRPSAKAFGNFAHALAIRYGGDYREAGKDLPRIGHFEAWNEPNLGTYITPQFNGRNNVSAGIYVRLLNAFYEGIKEEEPSAQVVTGGTAPYGDPPGPKATKTAPLRFAREVLCLNSKLDETGCAGGQAPKFDVYAHHPINREDPPTKNALAEDDVEIADFGELRKVVRKAEKLGTPATKGRHELWANEVWWQTNPPDRDEGVPLKTHARWMAQGIYLLWKQGASNVSFLQLRDADYTPGEFTLESYQTGVFARNGQPKPSARAVAFPFVTDRKGSERLLAWGRSPRTGKLQIEAKVDGGGGYRKLRAFQVEAGEVFTAPLRVDGSATIRAKVGNSRSVPWRQGG